MREPRRSSRRTRVLAGAASAIGLAVPLLAGLQAHAAGSVAGVGWWTRSPVASAPDGGFAVAAAPDGPVSVAAVRVDLGAGVSTLVLSTALSQGAPELVTAEVCVTSDAWAEAGPGAIEEAPSTACSGASVPFSRAGDGWRADVSSLVAGRSGALSLAVVPVTGGSAAFDAAFAPPAAIATVAVAPTTTAARSAASAPSVVDRSSDGGAAPITAPSAGDTAFSVPPTPAPVSVTTAGEDVSATASQPEIAVPSEDDVVALDVIADTTEPAGPRWSEALVLVLFAAAVGAGVGGLSWWREARS